MSPKLIFFLCLFLLVIPCKLLGDLAAYLYDIDIPSTTVIALPLCILLGTIYARDAHAQPSLLIPVHIFFVSFVLSVAWQTAVSGPFQGFNAKYLNGLSSSLLLYYVTFVAGWHYDRIKNRFWPLMLSFGVATLAVLGYQYYSGSVWSKLNESGAYLRIADLYALTALLLIAETADFAVSCSIAGAAVATIFWIGSRSTLLFFTGALLSFGALYPWSTPRAVARIGLFVGVTALLATFIPHFADDAQTFANEITDSRIVYTLDSEEGRGDTIRLALLSAGLARIEDNVISGNWLERLAQSDDGGDYVHNGLFLLDDFGILPFLSMILIALITAKQFVRSGDLRRASPAVFFCLGSMIFTRAYAFPYLLFFSGWLMTRSWSRGFDRVGHAPQAVPGE